MNSITFNNQCQHFRLHKHLFSRTTTDKVAHMQHCRYADEYLHMWHCFMLFGNFFSVIILLPFPFKIILSISSNHPFLQYPWTDISFSLRKEEVELVLYTTFTTWLLPLDLKAVPINLASVLSRMEWYWRTHGEHLLLRQEKDLNLLILPSTTSQK